MAGGREREREKLLLTRPSQPGLWVTPISFNLNANVVEMTRLLHLILLALLAWESRPGAGYELAAMPSANATRAVTKVLSRQKRYLAFPEGSSVSV